MISSRWKKVWADFWGNKTRTLLTILTIMVGTFAVGFINNLNLYLIESMDGDFLSASPSEAKVDAYPMDDETVKIAQEVPGINALAGLNIALYHVVHTDGKKISVQLTAIDNPYDLKVNTLKPAQGESSIPPLGDREILVDASAVSLGYQPGDTIVVEVDGGKQRKLRLSGYMHDAAGFPYSQTQIIDAYVTPKTMEWLGGSHGYNRLAISVAENPTDQEHVTEVAQAVAKRLEDSGATVSYVQVYQPGHHYAYTWTQSVLFIMRILGWLTVILSSFLIVNTITALMTQQTRQIGIMKATGGGTAQIFGMYIILILAFGLIALLIAVPLANAAAQDVGNGMADYLSFYTSPYRSYPSTLVQQIIVALVLPLLAALIPVLNSVRMTVREALTDYGISGNIKRKKASIRRANLLVPRPIRLSLRNAFRRKARLSLTMITLVLAGAIFIAIYNLWASFDRVVEEYKGYYLSDMNLNFGRAYRFDKVAAMAKSVPGVESVEGWMEYPGTLIRNKDETGTQLVLIGPPSNSTLLKPIIASGRWLTAGDDNAIVISNQLLRIFPDLKVGDWLTIKIDEKETQWHIVGVYTFTAAGGSPLLYVNYEYISQLIDLPGEIYSLRVITNQHDLATQQRVRDQLQAVFEENGVRLAYVLLGAEEIQRVTGIFDIFIYFIMVMAILIAVVGALGLTGTMSINVMERTREIGVIRAIGASNLDIQSIVIVEGMVIGLIGWVVSVVLSIPITVVLATGAGLQFFSNPLPVVYGLDGIIIWLFGTILIATIASALPARRASRLTVRDTLAYE